MKNFRFLFCLCLLTALAACIDDALVPQSDEIPTIESGSVDLISMTVPDIEMADAITRSKLYEDDGELKFVWQENDAIGVVPMSGNPLRFPIHTENIRNNTAVFYGGGWALKTSEKYAAFFPIRTDNQKTDIHSIAFNYEGQTETNYANYDFLATGAVQPKDGAVKFTMQRLSAVLKIRINMPAGSYGRYLTLIPNSTSFNVKGTLDLSGDEPVYNVTGKAKFIHTQLNADKTSSSAWVYEVYLMIPATDLSNQAVTVSITSDKGYAYEAFLQGKNFEAGKAYLLESTADDAKITNTNLIAAAESDNSITFEKESGKVNVNNATNHTLLKEVKEIDVSSKNDSTVCKQIAYFPNLEQLSCYSNKLSSLDVSKNTALTYLNCNTNQLTALDVTNNTALIYLLCSSNQLTALDVTNNKTLKTLNAVYNKIESLYIVGFSSLTWLDVSENPNLTSLQCSDNALEALDVSNCTALTSLYCSMNNLSSLNLTGCTALQHLKCFQNLMSTLDITMNTSLNKNQILCGGQYTNKNKTEYQTLTLTARATDTTNLRFDTSDSGNLYVTVVNQ